MHMNAFGEDSPGELVDNLRSSSSAVISLVSERDGRIIGHVMFSKLTAPFLALSMAPVGVSPDFQNSGVGSNLIKEGLELAKSEGWQVVFVLGDPAYYGRFGFTAEAAKPYTSPYRGPANMALILDPSVQKEGIIQFPAAFDEDIAAHQATSKSV